MRWIDAHSGEDVRVGGVYGAFPARRVQVFRPQALRIDADGVGHLDSRDAEWETMPAEPGFRVDALHPSLTAPKVTVTRLSDGEVMTLPVPHRFMHPSFLFQHVAFLPT